MAGKRRLSEGENQPPARPNKKPTTTLVPSKYSHTLLPGTRFSQFKLQLHNITTTDTGTGGFLDRGQRGVAVIKSQHPKVRATCKFYRPRCPRKQFHNVVGNLAEPDQVIFAGHSQRLAEEARHRQIPSVGVIILHLCFLPPVNGFSLGGR